MKKHNFYAGPALLSDFAVEETANAIRDFAGTGISLASISHRSKEFQAVMDQAQSLFKELMNIPEGYSVLYLGGGASTQFMMVPYNVMKSKAVYLNTGSWASKAVKEAKSFGEVVEIKGDDFFSIPKNYKIPSDADYLHITTNNTIVGTEILEDLDIDIPIVADASSDILSRPMDVSKYGIIYGGAQKNLGPSGVAFVIIRDDILGKVDRKIPTILDYQTHIDKGSMFNTPPVIPIYMSLQSLKWVKSQGGVAAVEKLNIAKSEALYAEIDRNPLFVGTVAKEDRSRMSVCWVMSEAYKELEKPFLDFATEKGMVGIKGHRSVGGFRASIYNACSIESVQALIDAMQEFEKAKA